MADEVVDVVDEKDRITGQATKAGVHRQGLRHRVAAVLLQGADGKYLIPTASRIKTEAGLLYHSAAGHVLSGESYLASARRELQEETGLVAEDFEYLGAFWFEKGYPSRIEKERFHVYRAAYRTSVGPVRLNEEQVDEQWLSEEELRAIYREKKENISAPLLMTCKHILGFEEERVMTGKNKRGGIVVYFGCSMLGGYAVVTKEEIARLHKLVEELGYRLASDHQTQPGVLEREAKLQPTFIHDRDYQWLLDSDVGVFEISNPSLGVGSEISDMIHAGKPVLMLFKHGLESKVSMYLRGKVGSKYVSCPIECHAYRDLADAGGRIRAFIAENCIEP